MKSSFISVLLCALCALTATLQQAPAAGSLTPPGPPGRTMKALDEIEPRRLIGSLPYTITEPGSYYVVSNLLGLAALNGITISANDVTLDLSGFVLIGPANSRNGVFVSGARTNVAIRNGTLRGWGGDGVDASTACNSEFKDLRVSNNGGHGLFAGSGSTVNACVGRANGTNGVVTGRDCSIRACSATANSGTGIHANANCSVTECVAYSNGSHGIYADTGSTIGRCSADDNSEDGIVATSGCVISQCSARSNGGDGIVANSACTVTDCSAFANGDDGILALIQCAVIRCTSSSNTGDGVQVNNDCRVADNTCDQNGNSGGDGAGIHAVSVGNLIEGNHVTDSDRGIDVDQANNLIIRNSAIGNTANYDLVPGTRYGAFINQNSVNPIVDPNPWANFSFPN